MIRRAAPCGVLRSKLIVPHASPHVVQLAGMADASRAAGRKTQGSDVGLSHTVQRGLAGTESVEELLGLGSVHANKPFAERMHLLGNQQAVDLGLPAGWTELVDPTTHRTYYFNAASKVTTWDIPQPDTVTALPPCSDQDIGSSYTRCDAVSGARELTFFFKKLCKNGVPHPPTLTGLPCNITCNPGQYLPLGRESCSLCEPGTYSIGGGEKYMSWESLPTSTSTRCFFQLEADRDTPCTGWVLNGSYIHSGEMKGFRLVDSILEMKIELLRAGSIAFEYRVDAERRWDGIYFVVDAQNAMQLESYQFQYKSFVWPLTAGFHTLQVIFHSRAHGGAGLGPTPHVTSVHVL